MVTSGAPGTDVTHPPRAWTNSFNAANFSLITSPARSGRTGGGRSRPRSLRQRGGTSLKVWRRKDTATRSNGTAMRSGTPQAPSAKSTFTSWPGALEAAVRNEADLLELLPPDPEAKGKPQRLCVVAMSALPPTNRRHQRGWSRRLSAHRSGRFALNLSLFRARAA